MMKRTWTMLAVLVISWSSAGAGGVPDLSGRWELDSKLSDDAFENLLEALEAGQPLGRSRDRGFDSRGGLVDSAVDERERRELEERVRALEEGAGELAITRQGEMLTIRYGDQLEQTVFTDGRHFTRRLPRYEILDATAKWRRGRQLLVRSMRPEGGQLTETYELLEDGRQLSVTVSLTGPRSPRVEYRRVYERAAGGLLRPQ